MAKGTLSNIGYKVYMSKEGVTPVAGDSLNHWESKSPNKVTITTQENNITDGNGWSRVTGLIKKWEPITMKFWNDDDAQFTKLQSHVYNTSTSSDDMYVDFTFAPPLRTGSTRKPYTLTGQIISFEEGAANTTEVQSYTIVFQPSDEPVTLTGTIE